MKIPDQAIIEAAKEAGLCFHECWDLDYTKEDLAEDLDWINTPDSTGQTKEEKEEIWKKSEQVRQEKLEKLRTFIELAYKKKSKTKEWIPDICNVYVPKPEMW